MPRTGLRNNFSQFWCILFHLSVVQEVPQVLPDFFVPLGFVGFQAVWWGCRELQGCWGYEKWSWLCRVHGSSSGMLLPVKRFLSWCYCAYRTSFLLVPTSVYAKIPSSTIASPGTVALAFPLARACISFGITCFLQEQASWCRFARKPACLLVPRFLHVQLASEKRTYSDFVFSCMLARASREWRFSFDGCCFWA